MLLQYGGNNSTFVSLLPFRLLLRQTVFVAWNLPSLIIISNVFKIRIGYRGASTQLKVQIQVGVCALYIRRCCDNNFRKKE